MLGNRILGASVVVLGVLTENRLCPLSIAYYGVPTAIQF
jgi:hypothetical protein